MPTDTVTVQHKRKRSRKSKEEAVSSEHSAKRIKISSTKQELGAAVNGSAPEVSLNGSRSAGSNPDPPHLLTALKESETPAEGGVSEPQHKSSRKQRGNKEEAAEVGSEEVRSAVQPAGHDAVAAAMPTSQAVDAHADEEVGAPASAALETHEGAGRSKKRRKRRQTKSKGDGADLSVEPVGLEGKPDPAEHPTDAAATATTAAKISVQGDALKRKRTRRRRSAKGDEAGLEDASPPEASEPQATLHEADTTRTTANIKTSQPTQLSESNRDVSTTESRIDAADAPTTSKTAVSEKSEASRRTRNRRRRALKGKDAIAVGAETEGVHDEIRSAGDGVDAAQDVPSVVTKLPATNDVSSVKHRKKRVRLAKRSSVSWVASDPVGGRFLHIDPVFTQDEKYLIITSERSLFVHSTSSSLLVRTLPTSSAGSISGFALSKVNPSQLYVSTSSGLIVLWDWLEGRELGRWDLDSHVHGLAVCASQESSRDTVYTLETRQVPDRGTHRVITAHTLQNGFEAAQTEHVTVLETRTSLRSFQVLLEGKVIIAASRDVLVIANMDKPGDKSLRESAYTWRELKCTEPITCFDAMAVIRDSKKTKKLQQKSHTLPSDQSLNVVVGGARGMIFVYEDLLNSLVQSERGNKPTELTADLKPRILHWHRQAVGTARWSLDGNYILSGGLETVLVLWQLDTGRRQELPHLTSAVDNVVVSPTGASYAVQLADNSVMVLSTSELKPKANIAGIQAQVLSSHGDSRAQKTATKKPKLSDAAELHVETVAAICPLQPNQILLAVPSSQSKDEQREHLSAPYLQTYDISSARHVSRQAITRNNATNFNVGPEATKLQEPDVKLMRVSHDGQWLATVEEWMPPASDLSFLATDEGVALEEQALRREVYLKFWSWDKQKQMWALEMRIDAPHSLCDGLVPGRVFDLAAEPRDIGFATIGEDSFVRVWKPKTRLHDGTVVRGSHGEGLVSWTCRHAIELGSSAAALDADADFPATPLPINACLAYSTDGSVLATSREYATDSASGLVCFIDTAVGDIRYTKPGLYSAGLAALAFVDRYLVILSDSLNVWDVVDEELVYSLDLDTPSLITRSKHLAISHVDNTFAVAFPKPGRHERSRPRQSTVMVFDPSVPEPLYETTLPHIVTALLPAQAAKGYIALDAAAEIRTLSPRAAPFVPLNQSTAVATAITTMEIDGVQTEDADTVQDVDMDLTEDMPARDEGLEGLTDEPDDDKPVVRPEQLAQIFDVGPSFALPPVRELFGAVVGLYARKPRVRRAGAMMAYA